MIIRYIYKRSPTNARRLNSQFPRTNPPRQNLRPSSIREGERGRGGGETMPGLKVIAVGASAQPIDRSTDRPEDRPRVGVAAFTGCISRLELRLTF